MLDEYDVIFIGGGISCLYGAYRLLKENNHLRICILEKERYIGGRIKTSRWHHTTIVHGAGVHRVKKDRRLSHLLKEFDLQSKAFSMQVHYDIPRKVDVLRCFQTIREAYQHNPIDTCFRSFAESVLGKQLYHDMVVSSGYSDYENAHVYETLYHYGIEDTVRGTMGIMPWKELITHLKYYLQKHKVKIITSCNVTKVQGNYVHATLAKSKHVFQGKTIVLGLTIGALRKLIRMDFPIQSQPFLRIYVQVDKLKSKPFVDKISGYTVVAPPLQKIIPISHEQGVYMVAYADNTHAVQLQHITKSKLEQIIQTLLQLPVNGIQVKDMKIVAWNEGTHYYTPQFRFETLNNLQRPAAHIFIIGEAFSRNQGWTEGALESVDAIFSSLQQHVKHD